MNKKNKIFLITGSAEFVGLNLVDYFQKIEKKNYN